MESTFVTIAPRFPSFMAHIICISIRCRFNSTGTQIIQGRAVRDGQTAKTYKQTSNQSIQVSLKTNALAMSQGMLQSSFFNIFIYSYLVKNISFLLNPCYIFHGIWINAFLCFLLFLFVLVAIRFKTMTPYKYINPCQLTHSQ